MQIIIVGPMSVEELEADLKSRSGFNEDGATLIETRLMVEIEMLKAENEKLKGERLGNGNALSNIERDQLLARNRELTAEVDNLRSEQATMSASRGELDRALLNREIEVNNLVTARNALQAQLDSLGQTHNFVRKERDRLQVERDDMERVYHMVEDQVSRLIVELTNANRLADQRLTIIERGDRQRDKLQSYKDSAETVIRDQANTIAALRAPKP